MNCVRAYMMFKRCNLDTALLRPFWVRIQEMHQKTKVSEAKFHSVEYGGIGEVPP
jgi:hypothetical protein